MAFDTTGLSEYVKLNSLAIATKAVANAATAKLLIDNKAFQSGVKGSAGILKMEADVTFQDGESCGRTPLGNTDLSNKKIEVQPIKDEQNFCPKTLYNTMFAEMISKGQAPSEEKISPELAQGIMDERAKKINAGVEKLLWLGDTTLSSGNLKWINGIKKQTLAGSFINLTSAISGATTTTAKLQKAYLGMPVEDRRSEDFRMFIGEDMYESYLLELAEKNIFKQVDDVTLFGTKAKLFPTPGLNETGEIFATRISNLQLGMDGDNETDKTELEFLKESKIWAMDFHFAVGVSVIWPEKVGHVDTAA